jgi:hypothetical protein
MKKPRDGKGPLRPPRLQSAQRLVGMAYVCITPFAFALFPLFATLRDGALPRTASLRRCHSAWRRVLVFYPPQDRGRRCDSAVSSATFMNQSMVCP